MKTVAVWNWHSEPVPDARLIVCAPGSVDTVGSVVTMATRLRKDPWFVAPSAQTWGALESRIIPALHIQRQADLDGRACETCDAALIKAVASHAPRVPPLACPTCDDWGSVGGLRALFAVKAERRALVIEPMEAIDFGIDMASTRPLGILACPRCRGWGVVRSELTDQEGFNMEPPCPACDGNRTVIDLVIVCGFDAPLNPAHVRGIVEQCRAAGIPVMFVSWGRWVTEAQAPDDIVLPARSYMRLGKGAPDVFDVGSARSGALLDGVEICDMLDWLGGE